VFDYRITRGGGEEGMFVTDASDKTIIIRALMDTPLLGRDPNGMRLPVATARDHDTIKLT
jgi:hypothetical protein